MITLIPLHTLAQEVIQIHCAVDLISNKVVETYRVSDTKTVNFSLDQTQTLSSFSGFYWIGKKRRKIKQKKLDIATDFSNINNPTTSYSYQFPKGKIPIKVEYSYQTIRNEVMFLSSFQFKQGKEYTLRIEIPNDYTITYQSNAPTLSLDQNTEFPNSYFLEKYVNVDEQPQSKLQLMVHPKAQTPNAYFTSWYLKLLNEPARLTAESKEKINSIVKAGSTKRDKVQLFYKYVCQHIKYYGHESGIKMVQPDDVNKVLFRKYGDCKDITLLLHAGFEYLDCKSYFGLLNLTGKSSDVYYLSSFNHAICVVDFENDYLFLDATDKAGKFGVTNESLDNKNVLILSEDEAKTMLISIKK